MAKLIPREDNGQGMKLAYSFIIFIIPLPVTYERHWAIPGKNQTGGLWIWNFQWFQRKSGISRASLKTKWNFQEDWPRKNNVGLEFSRDLIQFCGISMGGALFCLECPVVKSKNEKSQGVFKKVCPQPLLFVLFFWNSPFLIQLPKTGKAFA